MPDKDLPSRSANMEKAEGDRWTSDPDTVEVADRYAEGAGKTTEESGGISNRPLSEERNRQESLPDRGTSRSEEQREEAGGQTEGDVER